MLRLVLPRVRRLPDFVEQAAPFLTATVDYDPEAVRKHLTTADLDQHVEALIAALEADAEPFDEAAIERVLRGVADARGIKAAALIHAARIAATGKGVSPGIFEVLALLGKPLTLSRLRDLVRYLRPQRRPRLPDGESDTELQRRHRAVAELEVGEEPVFVREAEREERAGVRARADRSGAGTPPPVRRPDTRSTTGRLECDRGTRC